MQPLSKTPDYKLESQIPTTEPCQRESLPACIHYLGRMKPSPPDTNVASDFVRATQISSSPSFSLLLAGHASLIERLIVWQVYR